MKKIIFPLVVTCLAVATFSTIKVSAQTEEELGGVTCYARWSDGGSEEFTNCNGCSLVTGKSSPTDKGTCKN